MVENTVMPPGKAPLFKENFTPVKCMFKISKVSTLVTFFVFLLPHLFQLLGVFNPLTLFFIANDRTPRGMLLTTLFQVIFSFSSTKAL